MRQNYNFSDNTTKSAIKKELIFTLAENRSADTHHCAALFHRYAVVLAHPHAYRPEIILAGHRSRCKTVEHPADFTEFFMNFRQKGWEDKLRLEGLVIDPDSHKVLLDTTHYIFLQLPAFQKEESECETDFERWIYVLKNMDTLDRLPFKARMAVFKRLEDIVEIAALSKEDRLRYEESVKVHRDNLAVEAYALETGWEKGHEEGWNEGHKEGWNLGLEVGKTEGERNTNLKNAYNLKQLGVAIEIIAQATGLTEEEIKQL